MLYMCFIYVLYMCFYLLHFPIEFFIYIIFEIIKENTGSLVELKGITSVSNVIS